MPTISRARGRELGPTKPNPSPKPPSRAYELRNSGLAAADILAEEEGVQAAVLVLSSPDRLYRDWQRARTAPLRDGLVPGGRHLESLVLPPERGTPIVTVIDGASHALAFMGSALATRCVPLGVDAFGQTGSQSEVYSACGISTDAIVTDGLLALEP